MTRRLTRKAALSVNQRGFPASVVLNVVVLFGLLILLALTSCAPPASKSVPPILLFNGTGTSPNDVAAVEAVLKNNHLQYSTVNSAQLNSMSESQLLAFRLLIVPGGNYITIGDNLAPSTTANVRKAIQGGLNYLGICAGGLLAGDAPSNSLNLTSGVRFGFYTEVNQGVHKAVVSSDHPISFVRGKVAAASDSPYVGELDAPARRSRR